MGSLGVPGASWEVLGRPCRVLGGFLGVSWRSLGEPWGVMGGPLGCRGLPGWSLGVPGGLLESSWAFLGGSWGLPWAVLGAALGSHWLAYCSLRGPGVPWGVHAEFLELVIFCFGEVDLPFV